MTEEIIGNSAAELNEKLQEKYEVRQSQIYKRLKHLRIKPWKGQGQHWLDADQVTEMNRLNEHLLAGNSMESYPMPEPSGPWQEDSSEIVKADSTFLEQGDERLSFEEVNGGNEQINQIVRAAQSRAAGALIAERVLAAQFKDNPHMLDDDLRQQVEAAEARVAPKSVDPNQYANLLISRYQALSA